MTDRPQNVRIAQPADQDKLFGLMHLAHTENAMGGINRHKVWAKIRAATYRRPNDPMAILGVIDGEKGIEGMIGMGVSQWWYSDDYHIEEFINFVHPDHRRTTHAKSMLQFAKWFSEEVNLPLFIGVLSTVRTEAKVRLYERQVMKGGAVFCHNLNKEFLHHG